MGEDKEAYWYALKVFYNKVGPLKEAFDELHIETYLPTTVEEQFDQGALRYKEKPLIASLLFVKCPEKELLQFKKDHDGQFMFYRDLASGEYKPGRIDEREMDSFRLATTIGGPDMTYLGRDGEVLCTGDKVRVTGGIYAGTEGYIKRIKHDRKVLVRIQGVAVVMLSNIHPKYLEKIEEGSPSEA